MKPVNALKSGWVSAFVATICIFSVSSCAIAQDVSKPAAIVFDSSVEDMTGALDGYCTSQTTRQIEPPAIPGATTQTQIDCTGFSYFGVPRLAEFVFGDDALTLVWILTEKSEEPALIGAFKKAFGEPSHDTPLFTAFADHHAAVRIAPPEALYYSPSAADSFREWFDQQAAQE